MLEEREEKNRTPLKNWSSVSEIESLSAEGVVEKWTWLSFVGGPDLDEVVYANKSTRATGFSELFEKDGALLNQLFKGCSR